MGQDWTSCYGSTADSEIDKISTLEPKFPEIQETELDSSFSQESTCTAQSTKPKRKAMTFRDKYQKGQRVGTGPFGNFFECSHIPKRSKYSDDDSDSNSIEQD